MGGRDHGWRTAAGRWPSPLPPRALPRRRVAPRGLPSVTGGPRSSAGLHGLGPPSASHMRAGTPGVPPLLEFVSRAPPPFRAACVHSRTPLRVPIGGSMPADPSCSALVVSHHLDGLLRTRPRRFVAPRSRSWGSRPFGHHHTPCRGTWRGRPSRPCTTLRRVSLVGSRTASPRPWPPWDSARPAAFRSASAGAQGPLMLGSSNLPRQASTSPTRLRGAPAPSRGTAAARAFRSTLRRGPRGAGTKKTPPTPRAARSDPFELAVAFEAFLRRRVRSVPRLTTRSARSFHGLWSPSRLWPGLDAPDWEVGCHRSPHSGPGEVASHLASTCPPCGPALRNPLGTSARDPKIAASLASHLPEGERRAPVRSVGDHSACSGSPNGKSSARPCGPVALLSATGRRQDGLEVCSSKASPSSSRSEEHGGGRQPPWGS
jgi:hypothetical protein